MVFEWPRENFLLYGSLRSLYVVSEQPRENFPLYSSLRNLYVVFDQPRENFLLYGSLHLASLFSISPHSIKTFVFDTTVT